MFKSLLAKLTLALSLIFILLSLLTISVTYIASHFYQQEVMQKLNAKVASHIVRETELLKDDHVNQPALRKLFHSLMILNPSLEIYLLDHEGGILAFSAPAWKVVRLSVDIAPINRYLTAQVHYPVLGDDPRDFTAKKVFSAAPVPFSNQPDGYLYVILGGEKFDSIVDRIKSSYILSGTLLITTIGLLVLFAAGILLFSGLTRRLKKLSARISEFEKDPLQPPGFVEQNSNGDEIDKLATAFQTMALKINQQLDDLHMTDHLRRELVANASHDLRTPLATLQGYIETLLIKNTTLSEKERNGYLKTAIKHCIRVNKLVAELFELAKLDSFETTANREVFNLVELVEDTIQKFSLTIQKKNIELQAKYDSTCLFVYADIGLIERVLVNLLDNSIRSVSRGGNIIICLEGHEQFIQIKVTDNGVGIPRSEIPLIFDRFYQLDKNRNVENGNSGLGLAIVKRIIELHASSIAVSSVPGRETTFSFTLPANTG